MVVIFPCSSLSSTYSLQMEPRDFGEAIVNGVVEFQSDFNSRVAEPRPVEVRPVEPRPTTAARGGDDDAVPQGYDATPASAATGAYRQATPAAQPTPPTPSAPSQSAPSQPSTPPPSSGTSTSTTTTTTATPTGNGFPNRMGGNDEDGTIISPFPHPQRPSTTSTPPPPTPGIVVPPPVTIIPPQPAVSIQ